MSLMLITLLLFFGLLGVWYLLYKYREYSSYKKFKKDMYWELDQIPDDEVTRLVAIIATKGHHHGCRCGRQGCIGRS